jgi:pimeloyl-ACP methyl ester carboxylesterase
MASHRPRLLLVSEFTELEWAIKPLLEDWADVMSYDPPGIGGEPLPDGVGAIGGVTREMVIERGIEKLEEAGWDRFFVVAEGWGIANAVGIATRRTGQVAGLALGHAKLSFRRDGDRAPINAEVYDAFTQLLRQDARAFVRYGISQLTRGGVDEDRAERIIERIPAEFTTESWRAFTSDEPFADDLLGLGCPLLLGKHEGCLISTDEGFEDATAALPEAETVVVPDPPTASPQFAEALREFCARNMNSG